MTTCVVCRGIECRHVPECQAFIVRIRGDVTLFQDPELTLATYPDYKSLALWHMPAFDTTADHISGHATIELIGFCYVCPLLLRGLPGERDQGEFEGA